MARARVQHRHGTFSNYENNKTTILNDEIVVVDSGHPDTPDGSALYYRPSGASEPVRVANAGELTEAGINVETVTESQLSDATGDNIYLCVINGRWHKVICVSGSQTRAQYAVSAYHNFIYRWQSKSGDSWGQWTDWSPIGVADNIRDGAITLSKLGTDVLEQLANKGVRIITPEESAGWDDDIPLTFAGDLYDIAGWDYKLWVLNQTAATPEGGTNYFWEPLISAFEFDPALEAKMDLAPINPIAEKINAMAAGQFYGDTVNHKGVIKGGQEFYDTNYIDDALSAKEDIENKAVSITAENKASTTLFPTVGAIVGFVENSYKRVFTSTTNPPQNQDTQAPYVVGDMWVNTTDQTSWVLERIATYPVLRWKRLTSRVILSEYPPPAYVDYYPLIPLYCAGDIWIYRSYYSSGTKPFYSLNGLYICVGEASQSEPPYHRHNFNWYRIITAQSTLAGYGITDAYTKAEIDNKGYLTLETLPIYDGTVI